jgi:hypothetical protein
MRTRAKKYEDKSPVEFLLLREKLGLERYRKKMKRDPEERKILIELALKKIDERERDDFVSLGYKRTKLKI